AEYSEHPDIVFRFIGLVARQSLGFLRYDAGHLSEALGIFESLFRDFTEGAFPGADLALLAAPARLGAGVVRASLGDVQQGAEDITRAVYAMREPYPLVQWG